jgi:hypothetical protein
MRALNANIKARMLEQMDDAELRLCVTYFDDERYWHGRIPVEEMLEEAAWE